MLLFIDDESFPGRCATVVNFRQKLSEPREKKSISNCLGNLHTCECDWAKPYMSMETVSSAVYSNNKRFQLVEVDKQHLSHMSLSVPLTIKQLLYRTRWELRARDQLNWIAVVYSSHVSHIITHRSVIVAHFHSIYWVIRTTLQDAYKFAVIAKGQSTKIDSWWQTICLLLSKLVGFR